MLNRITLEVLCLWHLKEKYRCGKDKKLPNMEILGNTIQRGAIWEFRTLLHICKLLYVRLHIVDTIFVILPGWHSTNMPVVHQPVPSSTTQKIIKKSKRIGTWKLNFRKYPTMLNVWTFCFTVRWQSLKLANMLDPSSMLNLYMTSWCHLNYVKKTLLFA